MCSYIKFRNRSRSAAADLNATYECKLEICEFTIEDGTKVWVCVCVFAKILSVGVCVCVCRLHCGFILWPGINRLSVIFIWSIKQKETNNNNNTTIAEEHTNKTQQRNGKRENKGKEQNEMEKMQGIRSGVERTRRPANDAAHSQGEEHSEWHEANFIHTIFFVMFAFVCISWIYKNGNWLLFIGEIARKQVCCIQLYLGLGISFVYVCDCRSFVVASDVAYFGMHFIVHVLHTRGNANRIPLFCPSFVEYIYIRCESPNTDFNISLRLDDGIGNSIGLLHIYAKIKSLELIGELETMKVFSMPERMIISYNFS